MKNKFISILSALLFVVFSTTVFSQTIINHTSVDLYDKIPPSIVEVIKTKWLNVPGESHSLGYRRGMTNVARINTRFSATIQDSGTPIVPNNSVLVSKASWGDVTHPVGWRYNYGEEDWFTSRTAINQTKTFISYANSVNRQIGYIGFGWCWDTTWHNSVGGTIDPVYQVRWAGSSVGGPQGDIRWGLDAEDQVLTGNSVCLDTYLSATQEYVDYCRVNGLGTKVFFTTGPVDSYSGEPGYQRHLKYERIRNYVLNSTNNVLFDYADILTWNDAGVQNLLTWRDYAGRNQQYQYIHPDNMRDFNGSYVEDGDHIGEIGTVRLGKSLWVLMATLEGWNQTGTNNDPPILTNTPPTLSITPTTSTLVEGTAWSAAVSVLDDPSQTVTIDLTGAPGGMLLIQNEISWTTPLVNQDTQYTFDVIAFDNGTPPLSSQITLTINVLDSESTNPPSPVNINGLTAKWDFDPTISYLEDSHGTNDGQFVGSPIWSNGYFLFDGLNDAIDFGGNRFGVTTEFTISMWISVDVTAPNQRMVLFQRGRYVYPFNLNLESDQRVRFGVRNQTAASYLTSSTKLLKGTWYHVAVTFKSGERRIYVNGTLDSQDALTGTLNFLSNTELSTMGITPVNNTYPFKGYIDNSKVFNRALTGDEVYALFQNGE